MKNSWGTSRGEHGYVVKFLRSSRTCAGDAASRLGHRRSSSWCNIVPCVVAYNLVSCEQQFGDCDTTDSGYNGKLKGYAFALS